MADVIPIRIGVLGCAEIARKVSRAIQLAPNATLSAIASRSLDKAAAFARANRFPPDAKVYGSYEALLEDPDIDAVHMPLPTSLHLRWAVLAAQKKKHLLVEKPPAMNVAEFDKIVEACWDNGVQIMDGTMWLHHPRTHKMKEFLNDTDRFGKLTLVNSCFALFADSDFLKNDIRVKPDLDALGTLGDLGWYCINAILWAADYELPDTVAALRAPVHNDAGVLLSCGASLHWRDGRIANFHTSFLSNLTMNLTVTGTKGTLHLTDFNIPQREDQASFTTLVNPKYNDLRTTWLSLPIEHTIETALPQETLMVEEFARLVAGIKRNGSKPDKTWPAISRKTQLVLDAVIASIENGFEPIEILG
ncbi:hypothetical protein SLE2022_328760 [Rubroshorea leprosula]